MNGMDSLTILWFLMLSGFPASFPQKLKSNGNEVRDLCGIDPGWVLYKNEKCVKAFFLKGVLKDYEEAELYCESRGRGGTLLIIDFKDKQEFVENFLKTKKMNDSTWIGLKYSDEKYKWSDGTKVYFVKWQSDRQNKNSKYCVEIKSIPTDPNFGKWTQSTLCNTKKKWVVCEKLQAFSMRQLQAKVIHRMKNPFPVGFVYVQLPGEKSPLDLWPWMTWADISRKYDSTFFRVAGKDAAPFNEKQSQIASGLRFDMSSRRSLETQTKQSPRYHDKYDIPYEPKWSSRFTIYYMVLALAYTDEVKFRITNEDLVPPNMAIKIWQRKF